MTGVQTCALPISACFLNSVEYFTPIFSVLSYSERTLEYHACPSTVVFVLYILSVTGQSGFVTISATQLALIGVAIALVIIPFSRKLKILGVEFERLIAEKNDKKSD